MVDEGPPSLFPDKGNKSDLKFARTNETGMFVNVVLNYFSIKLTNTGCFYQFEIVIPKL
jgi:hypothetical protein